MVFLRRLVAQCALCCTAALAFAAVAIDDSPGRPLSLSIPSESLPQALAAFVDQTGLQLVYLSTLAEGRKSQSAPAGLSPPQALMRILAGTGIDFVFLNNRTVKLFKVVPPLAERSAVHSTAHMPPQFSALEEVVVTATKREELLRDVPVSATVLSGEAMNQAGVTNIAEIAAMTPGVEYDFNAQWGGGVLTNVAIRGIDSKVGASTTGIYMDDAFRQSLPRYFRSRAGGDPARSARNFVRSRRRRRRYPLHHERAQYHDVQHSIPCGTRLDGLRWSEL